MVVNKGVIKDTVKEKKSIQKKKVFISIFLLNLFAS